MTSMPASTNPIPNFPVRDAVSEARDAADNLMARHNRASHAEDELICMLGTRQSREFKRVLTTHHP